jgi:uncharacterized membrane protein
LPYTLSASQPCAMSESNSRWVLKAPRHNSLGRSQRWAIFAGVCAVGLAFGLFAALVLGAWVVLPFTGIELLAIGAAFVWWDLHANDYEAIVIEGDTLKITRRFGRLDQQCELQRAWAQVSREAKPSGWGGRRKLVIACKGRAVTFGEFLNDAGVSECQRLLRERLQSAWH